VLGVGAGCWKAARRALEAVKQAMLREYDKQGIARQGMDQSFCSKVRALDFKIYALYDHLSRHFEQFGLYEVMQLLIKQRNSQLQWADSALKFNCSPRTMLQSSC